MTRPLPATLESLRAGGKPLLAECLSRLETDPRAGDLTALLDAAYAAPQGYVIGLTGPPGVGKSTLISALLPRLRARGETVGIIAVDPSSRRSGGALLGDRTRIGRDPEDEGAFVRSMAARSRLGGLADLTYPATVLMRALFDVVIVETVGVGQSEVEIADCADLVVFCAQPGAGDALQFMKAGVMELPDLVLVTKGDTGAAAQRTAADLQGALSLGPGGGDGPEIFIVSGATGDGVDAALELIACRAAADATSDRAGARRRAQGQAWLRAQIAESLGRVGLEAVEFRLVLEQAPFHSLLHIVDTGAARIRESLKDL